MKPMKNAAPKSSGRFLLDVRAAPARSPIGSIPMSTPKRKIVSPKMTSTPPVRNRDIVSQPRGAIVVPRTKTRSIIGATDDIVSFSFRYKFIQ